MDNQGHIIMTFHNGIFMKMIYTASITLRKIQFLRIMILSLVWKQSQSKIKIKMTIGKGIQLNRVSNPSRVASMGAANFLKSGRCVNSHSLIFLSIHSAIGMQISQSEGASFKFTELIFAAYLIQLLKVLWLALIHSAACFLIALSLFSPAFIFMF